MVYGIYQFPINLTNNTTYSINYHQKINKKIFIKSNEIEFYPHEKYIYFFGNVNLKYSFNTLTANKIKIFKNKEDKEYILYANENIKFNNNSVILTGNNIWINLTNNDADLCQGTYSLLQTNISGSAHTILQRNNNKITIIKHGNCTTCKLPNNSWKITGSKILYDHNKNTIDIWDARFKIKNFSIFYWPYLPILINTEEILTSYIPNLKYSTMYGLLFNIPCPFLYTSKNFSGNISPSYISNVGTKIQTTINYKIKPGNGFLKFNVICNNKNLKQKIKNYTNTNWYIHWKHDGIKNKKWSFSSDFIKKDNQNYLTKIINKIDPYHDTNQNFLCSYSNQNWDASIAYYGISTDQNNTTSNFDYIAAPQLELNTYFFYNIHNNPFILQSFNQLTKFVSKNHKNPETIRIHTEPILKTCFNKNWINLSTESKLKITYYHQDNIDYKNNINNSLEKIVTRIIPQLKIDGNIIYNKKYIYKNHYFFLKPKIQYLYIPYHFQENIGIYDSSILYTNAHNLFSDSIYSGLDRINSANQIKNQIIAHWFNKENEKFYLSIGQIINLNQYKKNYLYNFPKIKFISGTSHWNINKNYNLHTNIQYDIQKKQLSYNTIILEYLGKKNKIFQAHYKYINKKYILNNFYPFKNNKTINYYNFEKFGFLMHYPVHKNWNINYEIHNNIKTKKLINHIINLQYYTSCWNMSLALAREIIYIHNNTCNNSYDNKIKFNIKIYNKNKNYISNPHKILNFEKLPYQYLCD